MTPTLEAMAREAGLVAYTADGTKQSADEALTRFAALVRAQALEDAARLLEGAWPADSIEDTMHRASCAAAIRAIPPLE